ncbi:formate/nitrite transporter family protein [Oscillospiraceae bacterium MB08-C2-2]|nr:formate/nitrite transporter family protein [Oscillospiraceae bacterium MB08-C2-2]
MLNKWIKAVLGGAAISVGGVVYCSVENHIAGAFLFAVGLFTIYTFGLNLYTGKVCLIPQKPLSYFGELAVIYAGNIVGTVGMGYLLRGTKLIRLAETAQSLASSKLADTPGSAFVMSVLCGVMMCVAVLGFTTIQDGVGKYLALIMPVMVFLVAGFEHSIANFFYISLANLWSLKAIGFSIIYALGNMAGGVILPLASKLRESH